jgi:GDP-4-dehydro-6-deoxy-D-mannose reductase
VRAEKLFITGMEGFVGSHLARYLLRAGHHVAGTVFPHNTVDNIADILPEVRRFECDVRDTGSLSDALRQFRPDGVFHLAGQAFVPRSFQDPHETYTINVMGGVSLLESIRPFESSPKIVVVSTAEVYGAVKPEDIPADEDTPLNPLNPYSTSKLCLEAVTHSYVRDFELQAVLLRPFNHTGPGQNPHFVCADFSRQIALIERGLRKPVMEVGNLSPVRDFTDVRDIVRAYYQAFAEGEVGEVYNLCSRRGISIREVLEILLGFSTEEITIVPGTHKKRSVDIPEIVGDFSKFHRLTGWKPEISFPRTLSDMLAAWREKSGREPQDR